MNSGASTIIIQRVIPNYRVPLFAALYEKFGILVVAAKEFEHQNGLSLSNDSDLPFIRTYDYKRRGGSQYAYEAPIGKIIKDLQPAIVISEFSLRSYQALALILARRQKRIRRLIFWSHGWQMERPLTGPLNMTFQYSRLPLYLLADAIATYSEAGAEWVRHYLPKKNVIAVGNCIDTNRIAVLRASVQPVRHGFPQLLVIGRFTDDKRLDLLPEMMRQLCRTYPLAALTIIGEGPARASLEREFASVEATVKFLGPLYEEEAIAPHFLGADVLVIPGSAGLAVNHALAYGTPVLTSNGCHSGVLHHPEAEYVVPDLSGIITQEATGKAYAAAIENSIKNGDLSRLRLRLRQFSPAPSVENVVRRFGAVIAP